MVGQTETATQGITRTFESVVSPFMSVFFVAFVVAVIATPILSLIAHRFGVVDRPDKERKHHDVPTAYLGGVAVFFAWLAGVLISFGVQSVDGQAVAFPMSVVGGAMIVMLVGLWDDIRPMKPVLKLLGQAAAGVVLISGGVGMRIVSGTIASFQGGFGLDFPVTLPAPVMQIGSGLLVLFFVVGACAGGVAPMPRPCT